MTGFYGKFKCCVESVGNALGIGIRLPLRLRPPDLLTFQSELIKPSSSSHLALSSTDDLPLLSSLAVVPCRHRRRFSPSLPLAAMEVLRICFKMPDLADLG